MKHKFLDNSLNLIISKYPDISEEKLEEFRYGLEGFYLTISKMLIIIPAAILLNVFKEFIIILFFYNILRETAFGLHASKSWICLISSLLIFVGVPLLAKYIVISINLKCILLAIAIILIYIYAPADTIKAPIIKQKKRDRFKIISTISCIILSIVCLLSTSTISTLILFSIYIEIILILPITYKIFNLPYNNYKNYVPVLN